MLDIALVRKAHAHLASRILHTPVEASPQLEEILGVPVWLKMECQQITGSFKLRGAWFALSQIPMEDWNRGVATCSAGNHGKALAYAAQQMGINARIYVPKGADQVKIEGMKKLGATVVESDFIGFDDTEPWAMKEADADGLLWISAYDDWNVMAGNGGTVGVELGEQIPELETVIFPVGGGGLGGGISTVLDGLRMVGCQHERSPALKMSLERGEAVRRLPAIETYAAGVEGGIGAKGFEVLQRTIDQVVETSEVSIRDGVIWMLENHQTLIEPTSAVALGAILDGDVEATGRTAVVITGRNVSLSRISSLLR